jgi:hypothetical protein
MNFALLFYPLPDMLDTMKAFFEKTLNKEAGIPQVDAQKIARKTVENMKKILVMDYTTG